MIPGSGLSRFKTRAHDGRREIRKEVEEKERGGFDEITMYTYIKFSNKNNDLLE